MQCGPPRRSTEDRRCFFQFTGDRIECVGGEGEDVRKCVQRHHENHAPCGKNVDQRWRFERLETSQRVVRLVRQPEIGLEALAQPARALAERARALALAEDLGDVGGCQQGGVLVALRLRQRDGRFGEVTGSVHDRVVRVLPALVDQAARRASRVGEVAVVGVGRGQHPSEDALGRRPQLAQERVVGRPLPVLGEQDEEQRRGVDAAVVGDERDLAAVRHLTAPQLVDDLARLLVGERVGPAADVAGQEAQRAGGHSRLERQHLQRGDERVAPERRHVPRDPGVGHHAVGRLGQQEVQVAPRAGHPHREQVVVAAHLDGVPIERVWQQASPAQRLAIAEQSRRRPRLGGGRRDHGDLRAAAGRQRQPELGAGLVEPRGGRREGQRDRADEVVEPPIGEPHGAAVDGGRQELSPPGTRVAPDLEDVHEVGGEGQRQRQLVRLAGERLHQQQLVELAGVHGRPAGNAQRAARQQHLRSQQDVGVGEIDRRLHGVLGHAGVEHDGPMPVHAQLELAQEAGAVDVEAELAVGHVRQVAPAIGHQEGLVVLEDELGQIGGDLGGENVVLLAEEHVTPRGLRRHVARRAVGAHGRAGASASRRYTAS